MRKKKKKILHHEVIIKFLQREGFKDGDFVGCEVGVFTSRTSVNLLEAFPKLFLYMVDPWDSNNTEGSLKVHRTKRFMDTICEEAYQKTKFARSRREIMRMVSVAASRVVDDESLDFVFVDAGHFYKQTKSDLEAWWPKVKSGGFLIGHDYNGRMEKNGIWGVKKAADEFAKKNGVEIELHEALIFTTKKP